MWGLVRGQANSRLHRLRQVVPGVNVVRGDLLDQGSLISAVERVQPDEVYNLAAISYVPMSWQQAELTGEVTGLGVLRVLEAIRVCSGISASRTPRNGQIRFYQASSSEMFGQVRESPQTEQTPFHRRDQAALIEQVTADQPDILQQLADPADPRVGLAADQAPHLVALGQQVFRKIGAILPGDPGDQCTPRQRSLLSSCPSGYVGAAYRPWPGCRGQPGPAGLANGRRCTRW